MRRLPHPSNQVVRLDSHALRTTCAIIETVNEHNKEKPMRVFLVVLYLFFTSAALADPAGEYIGQLSENPYHSDSTSNPYGEGLSIYGDDDG
jgi:hypothetical protein